MAKNPTTGGEGGTPRASRPRITKAERARIRQREARNRRLLRVGLPLLGVVVLVAVVVGVVLANRGGDRFDAAQPGNDRAAVRVGESIPPFMLLNAQGMPVSSEAYRGKPTIVVFFRTFG